MQILPKLSFKSLALGAAVALVISTAFAKTYQECQTSCTQIVNNYASSARTYYTTVRIRPHGRRAVSQPSLRSAAIGSSAAAWRAG